MMQYSTRYSRALGLLFFGALLLIAPQGSAPAQSLRASFVTDRGCEISPQRPIEVRSGTTLALRYRVEGVPEAEVTIERLLPGPVTRLFTGRAVGGEQYSLPHTLAPAPGPHRFRFTAEARGAGAMIIECGVTAVEEPTPGTGGGEDTGGAGDGGAGGTPAGPPRIEVIPQVLEFGEAAIGETRRGLVSIRNRGGSALQISPVRLRAGVLFTTCGLEPVAFAVPPGETRRLLFCFTPASGGPAEDLLEIRSNDPDQPVVTIPLRGRAPGAPRILAPPSLRMIGASHPTGGGGGRFRTGEPVTIEVRLEQEDRVSLAMESGRTVVPLVTDQAVRAGESVTFAARAPDTPGDWQLVLTRASAAPGRRLGFRVARGPRLELIAPAVLFPDAPAGETTVERIFLRNAGVGTLSVDPPALLGGPCSRFAFCEPPAALSLPAGGPPVPLALCFSPPTAGEYRASLLLHSSDPDQPQATLGLVGRAMGTAASGAVGAATIRLSADPPTTRDDLLVRVSGVDWPNACFPVTRTSVTRAGDQIVIDTAGAGPGCPGAACEPGRFPWSIAPVPLGPLAEGRHEVIVTYSGQVIGRRLLWVFDPARAPAAPPAPAEAIPRIEVTPGSLDLGDFVVGATGRGSITVRNTGQGPLAVSAARIECPEAFGFCDGPPEGFTLPPGGSREIALCFSPPEACPFEATLLLRSNDPEAPLLAIPVKGQSSGGAPALGLPFRGSLRAAGETNTFCVALAAGDRLLARVTRASGRFQPAFCVEGPGGGECWTGMRPFELTAAREGLYRIVIGRRADGAPSEPGDYGLYLQRLNRPEHAVPLAGDRPAAGEIRLPAQMGAFTFAGSAGETVRLKVTRASGTFHPSLRLYGPDGILVGHAWQPAGAELELTETLPAAGSYTVLIDDSAEDATGGTRTGSYSVTLSR